MKAEEWRSQLENLMPAIELRFPPTSGFRPFQRYFDAEESVKHPAKANLLLTYYLVKKHTCEGDVVLDPMAGTSSTGIVASLLGRHSVCVELEEKFCEWSRRNVERLEKAGKKHGEIKIVQGDARRLSQLLGRADVAITSPPYSSTEFYYGEKSPEFWQKLAEKTRRKAWLNPDSKTRKTIDEKEKPLSQENIGNLPLGNVDAVITSPPYGEAQEGSGIAKRGYQGSKHSPTDLVGKRSYMPDKFQSPENISRLPLGNIGNLKKETYLQAMLRVYGEMFRVLKPGGLAVIIVKPFIRNKRVVDLPWHTWLLLEKAGFTLEKLYKLRLKQQSFWRILQYKNNPDLERICHEYVIVAKKPTVA
jgi:DNA modification methylase